METIVKMNPEIELQLTGSDARKLATGDAGRVTMRFKRLLTVALMALFCAGTATAASQLNSVQVAPSAGVTTISLRTTGSYAHKEYRPDGHLVEIDLTGVTAGPKVERELALNSPVLKSYKLSSYTSASGSEVTRVELVVGDNVNVDVKDVSYGLQVLLSGGSAAAATSAPAAGSSPSSVAGNTVFTPKPATTVADGASSSVPAYAVPVPKKAETQQENRIVATARPAAHAPDHSATASVSASAVTPVVIRSVSVQRGQGTMDIVIEGPNDAQSFALKNPDRLVLDFGNAVVSPSVRNVAVHTKDVLQVRIGRFQAQPPVTRVVIDLGGPRNFNIVPSSKQVIVRIKTTEAGMVAPAKVAAAPGPAVAETAGEPKPIQKASSVQKNTAPVGAAQVSASGTPAVSGSFAKPVSNSNSRERKAVVVGAFEHPEATQTVAPPAAKSESLPHEVSATTKPVAPVVPVAPVSYSAPVATAPVVAAPVAVARVDVAPVAVTPVATTGAVPVAAPVAVAPVTAAPVVATVAVAPVAATPATSETQQTRAMETSDSKVRAGIAAVTVAPTPEPSQAPVEMARLNPPAQVLPSRNAASVAAPTATAATPKYTGEPISVNLKDVDLKDFFRLIHEISGLNIVLDPTVKGSVTLVLDDVPWDQALDIVLKNNALDRELQGNVLRIAATDTLRKEAVDRRAQSEAVALAVDRQTITRFLSYAKSKEVVPTVKKFLTARGDVISDERTNALIISDIPSVMPNLDRLISQLDRKSQEVEIEVRVVSATRSFSRDLGFQLGFNWGNGVSSFGGSNPNQTTSTGTTGGGSSTSTATTIPLFSNFPATGPTTGFSFSNITKMYGIDAVLTAAESHNLAKVLSRPRVVTQSNVKAEVKQGVKLPVYTAGTGNTNASVTYIDSLLRLSVTPQITADNTIFLTVDVENTQPEGTANSNGNYILSTQQTTTQVLVTDGGTVVIGGVIQTTNSVSTTQTPVLGSIPWLGNLFKERLVKTETDELIFFITPKIVQT
jgi:type IV pilus assembly protein PilQ